MDKKLPAQTPKQEIKIKKNSKAEVLKRAPDELIARAIHDTLVKQHENINDKT